MDAAVNDTSGARALLRRYRYDALDRLAGVKNGAEHSTSRFYQLNHLSVEVQGSRRRRVFQCEDRLLAEHDTEGSSARMDLLATDLQRSVLHSVGSQARQSPAYSPYGHHSQAVTFLGFNGEPPDAVTGHYLLGNGYRAFNPVLMRFNQPDNLSPFGRGGLNAYAYCLGDPVNRGDPSGHSPLLSSLSRFPDEILEHIFKKLPGKDLANMSVTSRRMDRIASGLSNAPKIDIEDPQALLKIQSDLKGETGFSPAELKRDDFYKRRFELAVINQDETIMTEFQRLDAQRQSFIQHVMGRSASPQEFNSWIARSRAANAGAPDVLEDIDAVYGRYNELLSAQSGTVYQRSKLTALAREIRSDLNSR